MRNETFECKNNHTWTMTHAAIEQMVAEGKNILEIKCPVCSERFQKHYAEETDLKASA